MTSRIDSADEFVLTLWTADPVLAESAQAAGIQRIGVDLEWVGKAERQKGLGTWISPHRQDDLLRLAPVLTSSSLFARVNPLGPASRDEIESVLELGARVVMLPMVTAPQEAAAFAEIVGGRATSILLVERAEALVALPELVRVEGVDEVHIGINDLALSLGLPNRWLVFAGDLILAAGATIRDAGTRFGLGGIGRAGDVDLPVPSHLVYAEDAAVGATAALVSRSFFDGGPNCDLRCEVDKARAELAAWKAREPGEVAAAQAELRERAIRAGSW